MLNREIAQRLEEVAALLEEQGANRYRVDAYRRAALTIRRLTQPVSEIFEREGLEGLRRLPGVGDRLSTALRSLILTGRLPFLDHLRGESDPVRALMSVPGIGRVQSERLYRVLGIGSLEDLEAAAHDGRLETIAGMGRKRISGIIDSLSARLGRVRKTDQLQPRPPDVPVSELLDVDREYRELAQAGKLKTIAPRRFNPHHEAWLPVLHTQRGDRHYTALFSNTARAHELERTRDWVVLYYDGRGGERQNTVVTARQGPLKGRRVVRGREADCRQYFQQNQREHNPDQASASRPG
jgi:DNA polymerase (family 10)